MGEDHFTSVLGIIHPSPRRVAVRAMQAPPESGTNVELETRQHQLEQTLKRLAESRGDELANLDRGSVHRFLRARLIWGKYQEDMIFPAEGRKRFPNISFDTIFDPATNNLTAGLSLTLETVS
jgi:hypothetical protein